MIKPGDHRPLIDDLLERYGLSTENFLVVESVQDWCRANGVEERNPFRVARCLTRRSDGAFIIVMATEISEDMIESVKSWMLLKGFGGSIASLQTDRPFLIHTVLHEIAASVLDTDDPVSRSKWAFEALENLDLSR